MAYVEEYFAQWYNSSGVLKEIKLLKEGGSGTTEITLLQPVPYVDNKRGGKEVQLDKIIQGREAQFNFISNTTDIAGFDAMFRSEYKEWKFEYYSNSVLDFVGWLQPENRSRTWIENGDYYEISLSATDGLANLKDVEFVDFSTGDQFTDRVTIMATLKRALEHVGFDLDFRVQLGTWCSNTGMTAANCTLDKADIDSRRYTKDKDGRTVNEDCHTIIEKVLSDYNVYFIQAEGKYWIICPQEINSYYFPIPWTTLAIEARTANDLTQSLTDYDYIGLGELQNIRPVESVEVTFQDRNIQDNLLSNGDFSSGTTGWNKSAGLFGSLTAGSGYGEQPYVYSLDSTTADANYIYTDQESITQLGTDDKLSLSFDARIVSYVGASGNEPLLKPRVFQGTTEIHPLESVYDVIPMYETSSFTTFTMTFPLASTETNYTVRWTINPRSTGNYTSFDFEIDNVYFTTIYTDGEDITFDRFYKVNNTDSVFTDVFEVDLFFGDSRQDNDIGSYQISGTRTSTWNRYGKTESISIQKLYAQNVIENFAQYKDYLSVNIIDPDENIKPYSILNVDSKNYQIVSSRTNYGTGLRKEIECELVEVLNTAVTTTITSQDLTSVDGESTSPSSQTTTTPTTGTPTLQEVTAEGATTTIESTFPSIQITSAAQIRDVTGGAGSIEIDGAGTGGYEGLNIGGRVAFVHDNSTAWGVWDDVNNQWLILGTLASNVNLYFNGASKLQTTGSGIAVTGAVRATGEAESWDTSDIRLKENIKDLDPVKVTKALMELRCIEYDHKEKKKHEIGLIAQEVIIDFPENIKLNDEKYLMIHYSKMIPLLLATIQRQEKRITNLENSIFTKIINWFKKWL